MLIWIALMTLIAFAAAAVSVSVIHAMDQSHFERAEEEFLLRFDELSKIERKVSAGLLDANAAELARAEIKQRIPASIGAVGQDGAGFSHGLRRVAIIGGAGAAMFGLIGVYALNDVVDLSAAPVRFVPLKTGSAAGENAALADFQASKLPQATPRRMLDGVDDMMQQLATRLEQRPGDVEGWRMLGWSYFNTGRFPQSVEAYTKAIELSPNNAGLRTAYGEALVKVSDGHVTDQAKAAFDKALSLDTKESRARVFIGLAKEQAGQKTSALDDWVAILNESDTDVSWLPDLTQQVTRLGAELGVDISTRIHRNAVAPADLGETSPDRSPTNGAATAYGGVTSTLPENGGSETQSTATMIRGMVDGLAVRLSQSPGDVDGWIRLIQSRKVLGDMVAAEQDFQRALSVFKSPSKELDRLVAFGRETGLSR